MRCWLPALCLLLLLAPVAPAADTSVVTSITASLVSNHLATADAFLRAGNADGYADLLADDIAIRLGVSPSLFPDGEAETEHMDKQAYLEQYRQSLTTHDLKAYTTNLTGLEIAADGQTAQCELVVFSKMTAKTARESMSMAMTVRLSVALRHGRLVATKLDGTVTDLVME